MISMYDAFTGDTTVPCSIQVLVAGSYDDDNHFVEGGFADAVVLNYTVMPFGDRVSGTSGQELKAKTGGERTPAFMKFTGTTELNINDRLTVYGLTYKVVRKLDYAGAGFWSCVGTTIKEDSR
jgi:hypothetical protein